MFLAGKCDFLIIFAVENVILRYGTTEKKD